MIVTRSLVKAGFALALLLTASCTDMGPTPETTGLSPSTPLPLPTAKPNPTSGIPHSPQASRAGRDVASIDARQSGSHRVRSGETVYTIARQYGVDAYALVTLNKLTPPFDLFEGQRLAIPGPGALPGGVATAEPSFGPAPSKPGHSDPKATAGQKESLTSAAPRSGEPASSALGCRGPLRLAGRRANRLGFWRQGRWPFQRWH